jgi:hypothetical protein
MLLSNVDTYPKNYMTRHVQAGNNIHCRFAARSDLLTAVTGLDRSADEGIHKTIFATV